MYDVDEEGFLEDPGSWSEDFARQVATAEDLTLTESHWELIEQTRSFHAEYGFSPSMRPLVKYIAGNLGPEKLESASMLPYCVHGDDGGTQGTG